MLGKTSNGLVPGLWRHQDQFPCKAMDNLPDTEMGNALLSVPACTLQKRKKSYSPHNSAAWWTLRICVPLPHLRSTLGAVMNKLPSLGHQPSRSFWSPLWILLFSPLLFPLRVPGRTAGLITSLLIFPHLPRSRPLKLLWFFLELCQTCPVGYQVLWTLPTPVFWHLFYDPHTVSIAFDQTICLSLIPLLWFSGCSFYSWSFSILFYFLQSTSGCISFLPPYKKKNQRSDIYFFVWSLGFPRARSTLPFGVSCLFLAPS